MAVPDCPHRPRKRAGPSHQAAGGLDRRRAGLDVPDGPGGGAAMIWTLRPQPGEMIEQMIRGAYQQRILPADQREAKISRDNLGTHEHALSYAGEVKRLT